mmetsp:Transcript_19833/g.58928  ORF Transcript_19833/g.58928 Transcript_19833/m.58928 type:complete len:436 (-) Transcript_19833:199-1506(-)
MYCARHSGRRGQGQTRGGWGCRRCYGCCHTPHFASTVLSLLHLHNLLPGEVWVVTAEVTVGRRLLVAPVAAAAQVERLGHHSRAEVEVLLDNLQRLGIRLGAGAIGVHEDGQRVGQADCVRDLEQAAACEARRDDRLGDLAAHVRGGAVHLGRVLAREGAAAVRAPAAIRVDNDLATCEAGVAMRAADDEAARGVEVEDGVVVQVLGGHNGLDHVLHEVGADLLVSHVRAVLRGDEDGVHALWDHSAWALGVALVLDRDLGLAVGAQPRARAILADLGQAEAQLGRQHVRQRHQLGRLIRGVAEHVALVAGTDLLERLSVHAVHRLANVRRLLLNMHQHLALVAIQAHVLRDEANVPARRADDGLVVHLGLGGDLAEDHHHVGLRARLARDPAVRVLSQASVQDGIGHLVGQLIRMSLVDGLGREHEVIKGGHRD